jgi:cytochrome c556
MDLKHFGAAAVAAATLSGLAGLATPAQADDAERATYARQGLMNLISWEAGPLFGMAKGEVAYDAEAAKAHAANLASLTHYPLPGLFLPGTSKPDRPGKTRALPDIWADPAKFGQAYEAFQAAAAKVAEEADKGQPELAAAVGEMGKACGGCHKPFRADDY